MIDTFSTILGIIIIFFLIIGFAEFFKKKPASSREFLSMSADFNSDDKNFIKAAKEIVSKQNDAITKLFLNGLIKHYSSKWQVNGESLIACSDLDEMQMDAYRKLVKAFESLIQCDKICLILSKEKNYSKSTASESITRQRAAFACRTFNHVPNIATEEVPMFRDLDYSYYLYPKYVVKAKSPIEFEIIPIEKVSLVYRSQRFIESANEWDWPKDGQIVGEKFQYVNKDGTPDLRYTSNKKVPVFLYGELTFSNLGLSYQISKNEAASDFSIAFNYYKQCLNGGIDVELDPLFYEAACLIVENQSGSTSLIQRKFSFGYNRACRLMDQIEKVCIVGPADGSKPRRVLVKDIASLDSKISELKLTTKKTSNNSTPLKSNIEVEKKEPIKFSDPNTETIEFHIEDNNGKESHSNNTPNNIFGITENYFNNATEIIYSLVSLYQDIKKDVTVMNVISDSLPQSFGNKEQKLAAMFHADIMKVHQHLGHSTANLKNKEGFAIVLLSSLVLGDGSSLKVTYQTINFLEELSNKIPSIFSSLNNVFDKYPEDDFFFLGQVLNRCRREDLYTRYFTLFYRLFSVIAKADNNVKKEETVWLNKLMELNHQRPKEEGVFKVSETNTLKAITPKGESINKKTNPIEELNNLIGLTNVKTEISSLSNLVKVQQVRKSRGMSVSNVSYHCVFTGNPGTGKTTVARIVAEVYKDLGVLKKGHLIETDRSGLVAEYVGQTAPKTNAIIDSALDGVLFIDEAYSLVQGGQGDYGKEAISTLLKRMEDDRDRLVVILAGYSKEMGDFINSNSGLQSRFNRYINFPDYSSDELIQIFKFILKKNDCTATDSAIEKVKEYVCYALEHKDQNFGNARFIRNVFEKTLTEQANRLAAEPNITNEMLSTIEEVDVINALKK